VRIVLAPLLLYVFPEALGRLGERDLASVGSALLCFARDLGQHGAHLLLDRATQRILFDTEHQGGFTDRSLDID
jgi:hypothetical protein